MDDEKIIQEVMELLKIPDIGRSLLHKIEELKLILSRNIDHYREAAGMLKPRKQPQTVKGTQFELNQIGQGLWVPTVPSLPVEMDSNVYDIIPQPLVDYIVKLRVEKGMVVMKPEVKLPELNDRVFDLFIEKMTPRFIWGIINERRVDRSDYVYTDARVKQALFRNVGKKAGKDEVIKLLLYYLLNCQPYYDHVVDEFFCRWKPLIDSRLIKTGERNEPDAK